MNLKKYTQQEIENNDGKYDDDGYYILPDGDYFDAEGYYYYVDGYDELGGYYDGDVYVEGP